MNQARLVIKLHRFEVLVALALGLTVAIGLFIVAVMLASLGVPVDCQRPFDTVPEHCVAATIGQFASINSDLASPALVGSGFVPLIIGVLIGAPLVSREVETRTATLAWWLPSSRLDWLKPRVLVGGLVVAFATSVLAVGATGLVAVRSPTLDITSSFRDFGLWGPLVVLRGIVGFGIGLFAGAVVSRALPALVLAIASALFMFAVINLAFPFWSAPRLLPSDERGAIDPGAVLVGSGFYRSADGSVLTWPEVRSQSPVPVDESAFYDWVDSTFQILPSGYPGYLLPEVSLREASADLGIAFVMVTLAAAVVKRRRPY